MILNVLMTIFLFRVFMGVWSFSVWGPDGVVIFES